VPLKNTAKRKHLVKCLQDSYYQDKGYLEGVVQDSKDLFLYQSEAYVELRSDTKE